MSDRRKVSKRGQEIEAHQQQAGDRITLHGRIYVLPAENTPDCACHDRSAVSCWRSRYNLDWSDDVQEDGGPCMCSCHDGCDDDEDYE